MSGSKTQCQAHVRHHETHRKAQALIAIFHPSIWHLNLDRTNPAWLVRLPIESMQFCRDSTCLLKPVDCAGRDTEAGCNGSHCSIQWSPPQPPENKQITITIFFQKGVSTARPECANAKCSCSFKHPSFWKKTLGKSSEGRMWVDLQVGRLRNGDRRPEVGGNLLSGSVTTSFATDMDVRFQARSRCHAHFRTKSRPWQPNQTMLGRIKRRKLARKWHLQIRPTHNTRHAAWASLAFHFTVPINARDSTNDCWTCTLAESAYNKGPERREERCTCAPERNANLQVPCRHSGIKFTMLPQPIWTEWNTSVTRPLQAVDAPWNPSHDPWGKFLPCTWKTYSSRLCPIRHVGKQMRGAWKLVPLHQLPSAWNIDWALLDETYPSAAEKIRRGFHNIRLVCHPNHFRLIQESGSFNFVNVYGTVRHDLVIAAKQKIQE